MQESSIKCVIHWLNVSICQTQKGLRPTGINSVHQYSAIDTVTSNLPRIPFMSHATYRPTYSRLPLHVFGIISLIAK